ncbi:MAG: RHS repeat domain-containing protein [Pirellulaceae bacterium]
MYSPILNRFTSRDPLPLEGEPDIMYPFDFVPPKRFGTNLYSYVENNPVNYIDPSGLDRCSGSVTACNATGALAVWGKKGGDPKIGGNINISGDFINKDDCKCKCCKGELWVRGEYAIIGPPPARKRVPIKPHKLPGSGKPLDPKEYQQDSPTLPLTGCKLKATDNPGLTIPKALFDALSKIPGVTIELHYDFELRYKDVCAKPPQPASSATAYDFHWSISGPFATPSIVTDLAPCAGVPGAPGAPERE